jgi:adenylosuccinate lyase
VTRVFAELLCEEIDTVARHLEEAEILGYHARTHHKSARPARLGAEIATLRVELTAARRLLEAIVFRFPEAIADDGSAPRRTTRD